MKAPMTPHDLIKGNMVNGESLRQHLDKVYKTLHRISFGAAPPPVPAVGTSVTIVDEDMNFDGQKVAATSPAIPNTEFAISHSLGRVPIGFTFLGGSNQGVVYRSTTPWTKTQIFLKETQGTNVFTILIV